MYRILITKLEPNPEIEAWLEKTKEAREFRKKYRDSEWNRTEIERAPDEMIEHRQLETVISQEQFEAVRKACLEVM